jgi:hypothetical protein
MEKTITIFHITQSVWVEIYESGEEFLRVNGKYHQDGCSFRVVRKKGKVSLQRNHSPFWGKKGKKNFPKRQEKKALDE